MHEIKFRMYEQSQRRDGADMFKEPLGDPIATLDHVPEIYEHLTIRRKTYVCTMISHQEGFCTVEEILDFDGNTEFEDEMICPWCGNAQSDPWELSEDESEYQCGTCGRDFSYTRNVEITYSTVRSETNASVDR